MGRNKNYTKLGEDVSDALVRQRLLGAFCKSQSVSQSIREEIVFSSM